MLFFTLFSHLLYDQFHITQTISSTINVTPDKEVTFYVDKPPLVFLLPQRHNIVADVYKISHNDSFEFVGSLSPQIDSFGVYFPQKGKIQIRAQKPTLVNLYAMVATRKCSKIFVSTYPQETFTGLNKKLSSSDNPILQNLTDMQNVIPNFTIKNNQDICFFHASNSPVLSDISYMTEVTYDTIYVQNGYSEKKLTGNGHLKWSMLNTSYLIWHSDPTTLSNYFRFRIFSNSTLPQFRVNFTNSLSTAPLFLIDNSHATKMIFDNANADLITSKHPDVPTVVTVSISAFVSAITAAVGFFIISRKLFRRQSDEEHILTDFGSNEDSDSSMQTIAYSSLYSRNNPFQPNEIIDTSSHRFEI